MFVYTNLDLKLLAKIPSFTTLQINYLSTQHGFALHSEMYIELNCIELHI